MLSLLKGSPLIFSFTSSLPIWILVTTFSCQIAAPGISSTVLHRSTESEYSCLIPDPGGKALSFSLLRIMLVVVFLYMGFVMLRYVLPKPFAVL